MGLIGPIHRYVTECVAEYYNIEQEVIIEGMADSDRYIRIMDALFAEKKKMVILFYYGLLDSPPLDSGRMVMKTRYAKHMRAVCTDGTTSETVGLCVAVYRTNNLKPIDIRTMQDVFI